MATLREFLSGGRIGEVMPGMTPAVVEQLLGPADDRSVKKHPAEILRFGSIELTFKTVPQTNDARLVAAALYFGRPDQQLPAGVRFEDWTPTQATTEAEFRRFASSIGLQIHAESNGEHAQLVLDSGASAVFDEGQLHSIHFRRADRAAPRRQMSVSLPESTLSHLRERAQRENISLQELIERVLSKSA